MTETVGGKINLKDSQRSIYFFFSQVKMKLSRRVHSYGQIMVLYNSYSDLDKNMLMEYAIWQMLSFSVIKKSRKCLMKLKLAVGLKYFLQILLELFCGLRQKTSMSLPGVLFGYFSGGI